MTKFRSIACSRDPALLSDVSLDHMAFVLGYKLKGLWKQAGPAGMVMMVRCNGVAWSTVELRRKLEQEYLAKGFNK